jgi:hypothetical protein
MWRDGSVREILFSYTHQTLNILRSYHTLPLYVIGPVRKDTLLFCNLLTCNEKKITALPVLKRAVHEPKMKFFKGEDIGTRL